MHVVRREISVSAHAKAFGRCGWVGDRLGGQLNDYFARIRLCLPDGMWNVRCERAWLRIYDCVTDVYRIHSPREDVPTNNDTAILSSLDRKTVAVDTSPVEFYSDAWGCWTEPMTFF